MWLFRLPMGVLPYQSTRKPPSDDDNRWTGTEWAMLAFIVAVGLFGSVIIAGIVYVWPSNHWSLEIRLGWLVLLPGWGYSGTVAVQDYGSRWLRRWLMLTLLLATGMLIVADSCNLLVRYEVWIDRGMPDRWKMEGSGGIDIR